MTSTSIIFVTLVPHLLSGGLMLWLIFWGYTCRWAMTWWCGRILSLVILHQGMLTIYYEPLSSGTTGLTGFGEPLSLSIVVPPSGGQFSMRLPTYEALRRIGLVGQTICALCYSSSDTLDHLFANFHLLYFKFYYTYLWCYTFLWFRVSSCTKAGNQVHIQPINVKFMAFDICYNYLGKL